MKFSRNWGDILVFLAIGVVGWFMKQLSWPRPPLLIGFVLTTPTERYLHLATERYGLDWLTRPGVIIIGLLIIAVVIMAIVYNPTEVVSQRAGSQTRERDQA